MSYLIVVCGKCGEFLLARAEQRTRTCPHCNFKITVDKAKKVAAAKTAYEASEILRKMKMDSALTQKTTNHP